MYRYFYLLSIIIMDEFDNLSTDTLEYTNNLQIQISEETWIDMMEFIDKYACLVRDLIDKWIFDKDTIKKSLSLI